MIEVHGRLFCERNLNLVIGHYVILTFMESLLQCTPDGSCFEWLKSRFHSIISRNEVIFHVFSEQTLDKPLSSEYLYLFTFKMIALVRTERLSAGLIKMRAISWDQFPFALVVRKNTTNVGSYHQVLLTWLFS